jgi:hypothetical protein
MFDFELRTLKNDGTMPQIGDNDRGRLFFFGNKDPTDHGYLLDLATLYFDTPWFKRDRQLPDSDCLWLFGVKMVEKWGLLKKQERSAESIVYKQAGWAVLRNNEDYCFFSCGPENQLGVGGHAHNDRLGFELVLDGETLFVDPGSYQYAANPKWRNIFRSTRVHNTICIDGKEQNTISRIMYELRQESIPKIENIIENGDIVQVSGTLNYRNGLSHERKIILHKNEHRCIIIDKIISVAPMPPVSINYNFQLFPGCTYFPESQTIIVNEKKFKIESREGSHITKLNGHYSPGYGEIKFADRMGLNLVESLPFVNEIEIEEIDV